MDNDRLQEIFLFLGDKAALIGKKWWYALLIGVVVTLPVFYLSKFAFSKLILKNYKSPEIIYTSAPKDPLQVLDSKIFSLPNNTYSGYFKIKNTTFGWGVAQQSYKAQFKTFGGTVLREVNDSTYVLPSSEKIIVLPRFSPDSTPDQLVITLGDTHFVAKPEVSANLELERTDLQNNSNGLVVSAGVKNLTAFTIKRIDLPVLIYNNKNEIVGVNFTYINSVESGETRTFQYSWPAAVPGAIRSEITAEVNIFDRTLFSTQAGVSPFDQQGPPQ
jgi:hypothetical protein